MGRVFARLDPEQFEPCFFPWLEGVSETITAVIASDGKTLPGCHDQARGKKALHLVSAWAAENRLVLAQVAREEKSHEITAIPLLLRQLALAGCLVSIDAMGTQTAIAKQMVEQDGDDALALKEHQGTWYEEVPETCALAQAEDFGQVRHHFHQRVNKGHARLSIGRYWTIDDPESIAYLDPKGRWKKFESIGMGQAERRTDQGISLQTRYYLLSFAGKNAAQTFAHAVRRPWGIEKSVHWVLDVAFHEDDSPVRTGHADHNLAVLPHLALNLLRQEHTSRVGIKAQRLKAAWSNDSLVKVLAG